MYSINELEFIGESLPKINKNFEEAHDRLTAVENQTTQYSGLSSFYATHSNNPNLMVELKPKLGKTVDIRKTDVVETAISNIVYPMAIYVHVSHSSTTILPTLRFSYKLTSSTTSYTITEFKLPRALGSSLIDRYYGVTTFMDLGFYDWKIDLYDASSPNVKVYAHVLYLP